MTRRSWEKNYPDYVDWDFNVAIKPVHDLLDEAAAQAPEQCLCDFLDRKYSFAEIRDLSNRAATGFQALGVTKGVHVGLLLPNVPQYIVAMFGVLKAGGTVVNYSPLLAEEELKYQIDDSQTDIMVTISHVAILPKLAAIQAETRLKKIVVTKFAEALPFPKSLLYPLFKKTMIAPVPEDDKYVTYASLLANDGAYQKQPPGDLTDTIAMLQYTGGTTGRPKGAMLTHASITAADAIYGEWSKQYDIDRSENDAVILVLPIFHIFGLSAILLGCIRNLTPVILHPVPDIEAILNDIQKKRPSVLPGVPTLFTAIANHSKAAELDFSCLKYCISGGAPLPLEVRERFQKITGVRVLEGYGLTETAPAATGNLRHGTYKAGSCGMPLPGTDIEIRDMEDPARTKPAGEIGEICIRGPQLMKGYWNNPQETAAVLRNGWLHTGDTGYMDEDGFLFIVDRIKDLIISSGFNVYPRHVEEAIYRHPAVAAVTVIGIPDDYRGEAAKAFVELRDGASLNLEELNAFLKDKIAKYEMPAELEEREALPRTPVGKLSKKELVAEEKANRAGR